MIIELPTHFHSINAASKPIFDARMHTVHEDNYMKIVISYDTNTLMIFVKGTTTTLLRRLEVLTMRSNRQGDSGRNERRRIYRYIIADS